MSTARDEARRLIFDSSRYYCKTVEYQGVEIDIKSPPLGVALDIQGQMADDRKAGIVRMLTMYCYVHGTDEQLFDESDTEMLLALPFDADMIKLQETVTKMLGVTETAVEEAAKNSGSTQQPTTS